MLLFLVLHNQSNARSSSIISLLLLLLLLDPRSERSLTLWVAVNKSTCTNVSATLINSLYLCIIVLINWNSCVLDIIKAPFHSSIRLRCPAFARFVRPGVIKPALCRSSLSISARALAALIICITLIQFLNAQIGNVTKAIR
jgi:hypothetical protein